MPKCTFLGPAPWSGGAITAHRLATGQLMVVCGGLARPAGTTEIVVVSALKDPDHICTIASWGNMGASDLAVTASCSDAAGMPIDARFSVLVVVVG